MQTINSPYPTSQTSTEILDKLLERLSGVTPIGNSWKALCPAHADQRPSLNIKPGYRGILLKCWAGCSLRDIVSAIGLQESDIFFDKTTSRLYKTNDITHERANLHFRWNWRKSVSEILNITETQAMLADDFLRQSESLDTSSLTDAQRGHLANKKSLAASWIRLGESVAALCYDVTQEQRRLEAAR